MMILIHVLARLFRRDRTARRALLLRAGHTPLGPRPTTAIGGHANRKRATLRKWVGSRMTSIPAERLDRVWPDAGPAGNRLAAASA